MEKVVFADTFTKNLKRIFKVPTVIVDNPYFQLHYKVTGLSLLFSSILVSGTQFFGEPIRCIQRDDVPEKLLNTYCWVEGTFSLPKAYNKKVGTEIVYEGVDKYRKDDVVIEHAYYQWVCFVLFLQALMFCFPYVLLRSFDGGKMKTLVQTLKHPIWDKEKSKMKPLLKTLQGLFLRSEYDEDETADEDEPETDEEDENEKGETKKKVEDESDEAKKKKAAEKAEKDAEKLKDTYKLLAIYFLKLSSCHKSYAIKFIFCEVLNIANVLGQIFFINRFLGGYFTSYGADVVKYANMDQNDRIDPMIKLFPRMSKCTFHRFGSSGDVQKHDALCLLPLNIMNEKIFVVMWFWFLLLVCLGALMLIYRVLLVVSREFRKMVIRTVSCVKPAEIEPFFPISFGNWFMLHMIAENLEIIHFRGFLREYKRRKESKDDVDHAEPVVRKRFGLFRRRKTYSFGGNVSNA